MDRRSCSCQTNQARRIITFAFTNKIGSKHSSLPATLRCLEYGFTQCIHSITVFMVSSDWNCAWDVNIIYISNIWNFLIWHWRCLLYYSVNFIFCIFVDVSYLHTDSTFLQFEFNSSIYTTPYRYTLLDYDSVFSH